MKILWLAHRDICHPKAGGAERTILEVGKRLVRYGHGVTVLTSNWQLGTRKDATENIEIIRPGGYIILHLHVPIAILKNEYDLIINDLGHVIPWLTPPLFGKKNIVLFRHLHSRSLRGQVGYFSAAILSAVEKTYFLIYRNAAFVTESTTSVKDLNKLGVKRHRIVKIEPGVDRTIFHRAEKTESPSLIYFGGMRRYKRPLEAIFLAKELTNFWPDLKVHIVGNGPELKNLVKNVRSLKLTKTVKFMGRISTEDLAKILSMSWLNVHTSITEGWGYSILEASAAGTPTVAYCVPGVVDVVENGLNGIKVKDGDRDALIHAATKILKAPEKWWSSSVKVAEKYSWDKTAERWNELLKRTVEIH